MVKPCNDVLCSSRSGPLQGTVEIPGDKSISHRALILGSLAIGETIISGLLEGADVLATKNALEALGVNIEKTDAGTWRVLGVGSNGMISPSIPLDLGNSGTGVRLLMGVVAGQNITATFTGDHSLRDRPMARITDPLERLGAKVSSREGRLPVTITGNESPRALNHVNTIASAQVKSAILLASLNARGITEITEPVASRDHSESLLRHFGANVQQNLNKAGNHKISLTGETKLHCQRVIVPRDPSSAAFAIVAALITPNSNIVIPRICMNPLRTGLITTLKEMGATIECLNERQEDGELIADLRVKSSKLKGVKVPKERASSMIDEYPILSVAAASALGTTHMLGIAELKVKETDRIKVMANGLRKCGIIVDHDEDSMKVTGGIIKGGTIIDAEHDHRIGMSFLVLGLVAEQPVTVSGCNTIETSFPNFAKSMAKIGALIEGEVT